MGKEKVEEKEKEKEKKKGERRQKDGNHQIDTWESALENVL